MIIDPLKDYPGYVLRRASAASMQKLALRLERLDLRPSEASVLLVIEANPRITQSEAGRLLDIAGANMAPLMRRLVERNLVERLPANGRSQGLRLTSPGRTLGAKVRTIVQSHETDLLARIPPAQREAFIRALQMLF